jgi:hypothetical protein
MNYNIVLSYNKNKNNKMEHFYKNIGEDWFTYPNLYSNMIKKFGDNSHFVEVGSWKGRSSVYMGVEIINSNLNIKFDCVDTWEGSEEHLDMDIIKNNQLYDLFLNNIEPVKSVINPIRKTSLEASKDYKDESLDFVFIDASHKYEDVLDDINAWLPKIKNGGIIAGHDYGHSSVNKAVNDFFVKKDFTISEDCWIYEKKNKKLDKNITLVTGLWDIKRESLEDGWNRSYQHYLDRFEELLKTPLNLIIYGDENLEKFVWERRKERNTQFIRKEVNSFRENEFFEDIQSIRKNENWLNLSGWLRNSTQASLELYNPLVMSKMFFLNDARILDKFNSDYLFWVDGGITNTVSYGYFNETTFSNLSKYIDKFSFVCFPYDAVNEIHGFEYKKLCEYSGNKKVNKVARGGFFGGPKNSFHDVNDLYYQLLKNTLREGYMGTEESIFTILLYRFCEKFNYFEIDSNGLIYKFFEDLGNDNLKFKTECENVNQNFELKIDNTALYIITFNSPNQVKKLIESMLLYDENFIKKPKKYLLNNSTDEKYFLEYDEICEKYGITEIHKDNIGICGGRQFIAEHADENNFDFYYFFEDDMFFYPKDDVCKNGFNRFVKNLYESSLQITKNEGFDFLKLSYTEFFGNNGTQWAWYNIPQDVRENLFPKKPNLPMHGQDPDAPRTKFNNIKTYNKIPYVDGEIYYSNWPQVVSKYGNKKMFLTEKWARPYEQTWMSYIFQETVKDKIKPGLLLITPTEHDRFEFYAAELRKES